MTSMRCPLCEDMITVERAYGNDGARLAHGPHHCLVVLVAHPDSTKIIVGWLDQVHKHLYPGKVWWTDQQLAQISEKVK